MLFGRPKNCPLAFVKDAVIFPDILVELFFNNPLCINAVNEAKDGQLALVTQSQNLDTEYPSPSDLYYVGCLGEIRNSSLEGNRFKVIFEAKKRINIDEIIDKKKYYRASYTVIEDDKAKNDETAALTNTLLANVRTFINKNRFLPLDIAIKLLSLTEPNQIINNLVPIMTENIKAKQEILETVKINERLAKTIKALAHTLKISELEERVAEQTQAELSKSQKEVFLREELKTIQKELGDFEMNENAELAEKIKRSLMPPDVQKVAIKELGHLEKTPSFSPEISFIRNYLDWLISMPWNSFAKSGLNIEQARKILDEDHYALDQVKERILEYLAIQMRVGKIKGPILCFVGPPGTGKTSIGKSIARALGRKFTRVSLGGIRDEAEIRGHRRTYVGAMPGRIIQSIQRVGEKNPVFMLDEIDKLGTDFRGDPSSALLEALDPEQNSNFSDHYLEVSFDLSDVLFIATANVLENIPPPLRDRMEVIEFSGYTPEEKLSIAKKFIWPKIAKSYALENEVEIDDEGIMEIIDSYTQEAGVRNLERELSKVARKIALLIAENKVTKSSIKAGQVKDFLGQPKKIDWKKEMDGSVGVVAALAVTEGGGQVLSVEASFIPGGKGNLILTGHLGEIMKESAQAALSYTRSKAKLFNLADDFFASHDVHVHVPMGAIPKDGPSAGVAIASALISAMAGLSTDPEVGMTGEITLRGRVMAIGGLKEKVLAARRAGLQKVILPESNQGDLNEIDNKYKQNMNFFLVKNMDEVLPVLVARSQNDKKR